MVIISTHPLQSKDWAEFRKEWGNKVVSFPFGNITLHKIPKTKYFVGVFEKGPMPNKKMLEMLKDYSEKNNIIFIKLEPNVTNDLVDKSDWKLIKKYCVKGKRIFTKETFWIDLTKKESELLESFHSKTRYNIRYAKRKGVVVKEDNSDKAFKKYLELTFQTAKRQGFFAHTPKYHKLMWKHLHKNPVSRGEKPIARLLTAVYKGEILTTWIVFVYDQFLYYPYGASSDKHRNVMANNLMLWEAIQYGKAQHLKVFDLWGREEGKGFTKFKEGFNPEVITFMGTWDLVNSLFMYQIYSLLDSFRWFVLRNLRTITHHD